MPDQTAEQKIAERAENRFTLRTKFQQDVGAKSWWTNPVCHGELAFASWEYQEWLENLCLTLQREKDELEKVAVLYREKHNYCIEGEPQGRCNACKTADALLTEAHPND